MAQKTIEDKELDRVANLGIECFVQCVSNKIDEAKDDVRSIALNFDIKTEVGGELKMIGKGNNLNINNVTPEHYAAFCAAFGVKGIDTETPFVAVLYKASDHQKHQDWIKARARSEKEIDENQSDITEDPDAATPRQDKFIADLLEKKEGAQEAIDKFFEDEEIEEGSTLTKKQASALIDVLKALEDAPEEQDGTKAPTAGEKLIDTADFPTRLAGGLERDVVVEKHSKEKFLYAHAVMKKKPTAKQIPAIEKKLQEMTGIEWSLVNDKTFNAHKTELNPEE